MASGTQCAIVSLPLQFRAASFSTILGSCFRLFAILPLWFSDLLLSADPLKTEKGALKPTSTGQTRSKRLGPRSVDPFCWIANIFLPPLVDDGIGASCHYNSF